MPQNSLVYSSQTVSIKLKKMNPKHENSHWAHHFMDSPVQAVSCFTKLQHVWWSQKPHIRSVHRMCRQQPRSPLSHTQLEISKVTWFQGLSWNMKTAASPLHSRDGWQGLGILLLWISTCIIPQADNTSLQIPVFVMDNSTLNHIHSLNINNLFIFFLNSSNVSTHSLE